MAQGRSTTVISTFKWIRTIRFSTKNSLSGVGVYRAKTRAVNDHRPAPWPLDRRHLHQPHISEQLLSRNEKRFRGGLVFKAHRFLYHSTLGSRVIKKKKKKTFAQPPGRSTDVTCGGCRGYRADVGQV